MDTLCQFNPRGDVITIIIIIILIVVVVIIISIYAGITSAWAAKDSKAYLCTFFTTDCTIINMPHSSCKHVSSRNNAKCMECIVSTLQKTKHLSDHILVCGFHSYLFLFFTTNLLHSFFCSDCYPLQISHPCLNNLSSDSPIVIP